MLMDASRDPVDNSPGSFTSLPLVADRAADFARAAQYPMTAEERAAHPAHHRGL
jgi:hypothetical protein